MQAERWRRVQELFEAAADLEPDAAAAVLESRCDDPELRAEVTALILNSTGAESFFAVRPVMPVSGEGSEPEEGERIGPWKVVRRIGRGGMGSVFLAERDDGQFQKQVAIKVLRAGLATPALLRQFRAERQMLARLDHPHISRVLDAGVTQAGLPYVVMEYVEGAAITTWCEAQHKPIEDRLRLFRLVCAAVHHAHQHLVVHGDIKPGNIFVAADGTPKLLDFGVGRLLGEPEPGETGTPAGLLPRLMTPEYASPEQMRGEGVTTSTDVYSLGALLTELLTGRIPPPAHPPNPAQPPSRLVKNKSIARRLRGDLDTIAQTAMHEQEDRRYASAERLSDDVRRYLGKLPLAARPDAVWYRIGKYLSRNKLRLAPVVALALMLIALALFERRQNAETARKLAEVTAMALGDQVDFSDQVDDLPGTLGTRLALAKRNLTFLQGMLQRSPADIYVQRALTYYTRRLGQLEFRRLHPNLGNSGPAIVLAQRALDGYRELEARSELHNGTNPYAPLVYEIAEARRQVVHLYAQLGDLLVMTRRDFQGAEDLHRKEEARLRELTGGREGTGPEVDWQSAHLELRRARDAVMREAPAEALRHAAEAEARLMRMIPRYKPDTDYALYRGYAQMAAAEANLQMKEGAEAEARLRLARPEMEASMERNPGRVTPQAYWVIWQTDMASAQAQSGQCGAAIATGDSAVNLARYLVHLDPESTFGYELLARTLDSTSRDLGSCRDKIGADRRRKESVEIWTALTRHDPANVEWKFQLDRTARR